MLYSKQDPLLPLLVAPSVREREMRGGGMRGRKGGEGETRGGGMKGRKGGEGETRGGGMRGRKGGEGGNEQRDWISHQNKNTHANLKHPPLY